ncbi:hypothetical protein [Anaerotignum sp. MB30-C6]|uniref:hypothetical protein n=1 Tax=Anaerotignum sp. MB30-C6 TaxID=3070814 RepID=UPI0027DE8EA1|nr:hypothetical protein [Anaerotignum sp. MB30-C6]WMI82191.1 hypothetical protein RBQ60_05500 [Anaerotignum sp. MB30-C6]
MSYQCRLRDKDCDGCGDCQQEVEPCPNCNGLDYETKYFRGNEWIGCDQCIERSCI